VARGGLLHIHVHLCMWPAWLAARTDITVAENQALIPQVSGLASSMVMLHGEMAAHQHMRLHSLKGYELSTLGNFVIHTVDAPMLLLAVRIWTLGSCTCTGSGVHLTAASGILGLLLLALDWVVFLQCSGNLLHQLAADAVAQA
jgi:hypothetical protein